MADVLAGQDGTTYYVRGTVTNIYNTTYGNWYLVDDTGSILIYGTLDANGQEKNFTSLGLAEGDEVAIRGPRSTHNGTIELVNVTVLEIVKSLVKLEQNEYEVDNTAGTLDIPVSVAGKSISATSDSEWLNVQTLSGTSGNIIVTVTYGEYMETTPRSAVVTLTSTDGDASSTVTVTVTQNPPMTTYTKATEIAAGTYILVAEVDGKYYAATTVDQDRSYGYLDGAEVTLAEDGSITTSNVYTAFTLTAVEGGFNISDFYGRYLYMSESRNNFNVASEAVAEDIYVWTVTANEDGTVEIVNKSTQKTVQYSASYDSYGAYEGDVTSPLPVLYKAVEDAQ